MKKFLIGLIVLMSAIIVATVVVYRRSVAPHNQAKEEATAIANREANITTVEDFYWYNGSETYFTITGTSDEGEELIAIIHQDSGEVTTLPVEETFSESEAIHQVVNEKSPERILQARIGIEDERPIWEVSYRNENGRIGYYLMSLENGEWIRTIDNI